MRYLALLALLLVTACAAPSTAAASAGPDDLVLRLRTTGGLLPVGAALTGVPELSVYGDGRVITDGPVPAVYPGPALPNLRQTRISRRQLTEAVERARKAGVGGRADTGTPNVADGPTTSFTIRTATGLVTTSVLALDVSGGELTAAQRAARHRLKGLAEEWRKLAPPGAPAPYEFRRVAAVATAYQPPAAEVPAPTPALDWPGPALPGAPVPNRPANCLTVDAATVRPAIDQANAATPWRSAGTLWSVRFRPLLPDESSCDDLRA